jgi:hypothetical protein
VSYSQDQREDRRDERSDIGAGGALACFALERIGGRLASSDFEGKIKLWPKDGAGEPVVLTHGSTVLSLAVLEDGRLAMKHLLADDHSK